MKRRIALLLCVILILSSFAGCAGTSTAKTDSSFLYNNSTGASSIQDSDRYIFYLSNDKYEYIDKKTGKRGTFLHDAFSNLDTADNSQSGTSEADTLSGFLSFGKTAYYLVYNQKGRSNSGTDIHMLRLANFHDQIIYRQNAFYYSQIFLGLYALSSPNTYDPNDDDFSKNTNIQSDSYTDARGAFLLGNTPYVITDSTVFKINTLTGETTTLFSYKGSVSCDGSSFYYGNAQYMIVRYDIKSGKTLSIPKIYAREFVLTKTKLLYTNILDHERLYKADKDGNRAVALTTCAAAYPAFDDDYLYFSNTDDNGYPYRVKYDGSDLSRLSDKISDAMIFPIRHYDKIGIYGELESGDFSSAFMDKRTLQVESLESD